MPAVDPFENYAQPHVGIPGNGLAVVPNDNADLSVVSSCIWIGTSGDLRVTMMNDEVVTFKEVASWIPARVKRIHATGTTASDIVILW